MLDPITLQQLLDALLALPIEARGRYVLIPNQGTYDFCGWPVLHAVRWGGPNYPVVTLDGQSPVELPEVPPLPQPFDLPPIPPLG